MSKHVIVNADYVQEFMKGSDISEHMRDYLAQMDEVVRCRDCKFGTALMNGMCDCDGKLAPKSYVTQVEPDGFCAWGKRRDAE